MPDEPSSYSRRFIQAAFSAGLQRRSLALATIVGSILNLVNQGDLILGGQMPDLGKILLTYIVPYCVVTYGGVSALMNRVS